MTFDKYKQNLEFDGSAVYSYGTKVARLSGPHLIQLGSWSKTTQKHINYAGDQLGLRIIPPIDPNTQFAKDLERTIDVNDRKMPVAIWNLILSRRDVSLYTKGIRINRHWKITDVKTYFGLKGSPEKVLRGLEDIIIRYEDCVQNFKEQAS